MKDNANIATSGADTDDYDKIADKVASALIRHLDNLTGKRTVFVPPQWGNGSNMPTKITRSVTIAGKKRWIRANTEQEYADKIIAIYDSESKTALTHDFGEYAQKWFEVYAAPNVETATATTYKRQLDLYLIPHCKDIAVENITLDDIQKLFNSMSGAKSTKDKAKIVLNMILDAAVEDNLLERNPLKSKRLRITGTASKVREPYSIEEMRYMVQNLPKVQNPSDRAFLAISATHPLRLEEVLGLKWKDIDLESKVIHIRRSVTHPTRSKPEVKDTKTPASVRDIALSSIAAEFLVPGKPNDFVIGGENPLSYTMLRHMRQRIQKDIGFHGDITPARFRPTVLTDIYDGTKDIKKTQAAAGHTTASMTLEHYINGRGTVSSETADIIDKIYGLQSA